ncbi:MAG: NAD(P)-dependent alcohol dehydrogenase [Pelagibacterales bacterium]|nr:NAD(P)-dependent alcohol dehydrogenase [Pelagibacterales bacterium]
MKIWEVKNLGLDNLSLSTKDIMPMADNEVLVNMKAATLNFRDLIMIDGGYGATGGKPPFIPISDGAGLVKNVGKNVKNFKVGDIVIPPFFKGWDSGDIKENTIFSSLGGKEQGVMQEYMIFKENNIVHAPNQWSCLEAATLPCAALTAWRTIVTEGKVNKDSIVLVQGLGGVSIFAIQIAKMFNAQVVATTSSEDRMKIAKNIGADFVINYKKDNNWWKKVLEVTDNKGADIIVEVGGSKTLEQSIKCSRIGAVIGVIGVLSGGIAELPIGRVIYKASRLIGITCGNKKELTDMINKFNSSNTKPIIDSIYKFEDLPKALRYMSKGNHLGKIAIDFDKE